ncbi:early nodulin-like protein 7 [Prunus dulcis]|uniref:Early nodulin-like protein 7 n=1 Tax=Prunus dulcis TaxID=3755 RepID=A0A5H2XQY2_PRUDU|nr:early nodulin-like protein 7 [Prunus dulcis]
MVPPITPLLSKANSSASSTSSADASYNRVTPISKKKIQRRCQKSSVYLSSIKKTKKHFFKSCSNENESEKMVATKSMEEIVSDSEIYQSLA